MPSRDRSSCELPRRTKAAVNSSTLPGSTSKEIAKALTLANTKTRYESLGAEPVGLDNTEFKALLANETKMLSALIKEAKINID